MKRILRTWVGLPVRITWRDPASFDTEGVPTGRAGLARWTEYGRLASVAEGVVTLIHAEVVDALSRPRYQGSCIPEELIEDVVVLRETKEGAG